MTGIWVERLKFKDISKFSDFVKKFKTEESSKEVGIKKAKFLRFWALTEVFDYYFGFGPCFVAKSDNEIIGFCEGLNFLGKTYVGIGILEKFQGRGIGKLMIKCMKEYVKKNKLSTRTRVRVLKRNQRGNAFFKMQGFKIIKEGKKWNTWDKKI